MEPPAPVRINPPIGKPIPTPEEVCSWSSRRLLDHLEPIFALHDEYVRNAFRNALVDGSSFLELFGSYENSTRFGIPEIPSRRLAEEVDAIMGGIAAPLNSKRTYSLNRRQRWQLQKPVPLTPCAGPGESAELIADVRPQKRPTLMTNPVNRVKNSNDGPSSTYVEPPANCYRLDQPTRTDIGDGGVHAGIVERSVQVDLPPVPSYSLQGSLG